MLSIESIYFLRGHNQYSDILEKLRGQLENEGRTQCLPGGDDSLLVDGLVSALSGVKALVVLDDIRVEDNVLIEFSARLLEISNSIRLLISTSKEVNITSPYAERQVYKLGPLNVVPAITLFDKACPHADINAKDATLLEKISSSESLFKKIGGGVPADTLKAAKQFKKEEYENLFQAQSHTRD
uniref:NB-ARC domain-containing protein n=1 Tax=Pseudictyota dubia TaxID=2749911 RepID=A0A7R9WAT8_9STRA